MTTQQDTLKPLAGRRVVVIGGTSGMGLAAAKAAHDAGAHVIAAGRRAITDRKPPAANDPSFVQETVDITDEASVKTFFERVGTLDHLLITSTPPSKGPGKFLEQDVNDAQQFMLGKFFGNWVPHAGPHRASPPAARSRSSPAAQSIDLAQASR